jgi:hypothetical protein
LSLPLYKDFDGPENVVRGSALQRHGRDFKIPGRGGYPTAERVQEIQSAAGQLGQRSVFAGRTGVGRGA